MLKKLMGELQGKVRELEEARRILQEPALVPFDEDAAGRGIAQARVSDLMTAGQNSAEKLAADFEQQRVAQGKKINEQNSRQGKAREQIAITERLVVALTAQALEIDATIRRELAAHAEQAISAATQHLAKSAAAYFGDYINLIATKWLRSAVNLGEKGRQFEFPDAHQATMAVPTAAQSLLPGGFVSAYDDDITYKSYELKPLIRQRVLELMAVESGGLYPSVGADLVKELERRAAAQS
jgi:hypothetical protein